MKKVFTIFSILFLLNILNAYCGNPGPGDLTTAQFKPEKASAYLVDQCYDLLRWQIPWGRSFSMLANIASDDAFSGGASAYDISSFVDCDGFKMTSINSAMGEQWKKCYEGIRRSNFLLDFSTEGSNASMDRYRAEAKFLRAYHYFNLVRAFGSVPVILTSDIKIKHNFAESTISQVYAQIELDLTTAIPNLPLKSSLASTELDRATMGAAQALLGKVYLYEHKYTESANVLNQLIASGQYQLLPNFSDVFKCDNKHHQESIFEIAFTDQFPVDWNQNKSNLDVLMMGIRGASSTYAGFGFCPISVDLVNSFKNQHDTIRWVGTILSADTLAKKGIAYSPMYQNTGYFNNKYPALKVNTVDPTYMAFRQNEIVLRYADVLLLCAEAQYQLGNQAMASVYLNVVRSRAKLAPVAASGPALLSAIQDERQLELAMEGNRYFDLVRWGKAQQVLGPLGFVAGTNGLWPKPAVEMMKNPSLMQNPGYNDTETVTFIPDNKGILTNILSPANRMKFKLDSVFSENYNYHQTDSMFDGKERYTRDKISKSIAANSGIWDYVHRQWDPKGMYADTLNLAGSLLSESQYNFNGSSGKYITSTRYTSTYDDLGRPSSWCLFLHGITDDTFQPAEFHQRYPDENGMDTMLISRMYQGGQWIDSYVNRYSNTYYSDKRIKSVLYTNKFTAQLNWSNPVKWNYYYNDVTKSNLRVTYNYNGSAWLLSSANKDSTVYNAKNKPVVFVNSYFTADSVETPSSKYLYAYDDQDRVKALSVYSWNTYLDCWELQNKNIYTYQDCPATNVVKNDSTCSGILYTLPDGTKTSTAGTYVISLKNINDCDSIVTINLKIALSPSVNAGPDKTICSGETERLSATGVGTISWENLTGNPVDVVPTIQTTYKAMAINNCGSASDQVTVNVNPIPVKPTITQTGNSLGSDAVNGNQWFDANGIIPAETGKTFSPSTDGDYYVMVTENGCNSEISNTIHFVKTGLSELEEDQLLLYPSPVNQKLTLQSGSDMDYYEVYSVSGNLILKKTDLKLGQVEIDMSMNPTGIYTIRIGFVDKSKAPVTRKVAKQ